ncbi:hypothetical protein QPK87_14935 [Kamptonema cortianum]|nr:hypothetical protein [Oscillatoria laete-virens]MDK3157858.1 hypothetical protein [Kamptonema cortianum]MDL5052697.1 hypothetical protein [Oscillatoria laete-virens NRMC-F 0139]
MNKKCYIIRKGDKLELHSPHFVQTMDTRCGLTMGKLLNRVAEKNVVSQGGPEVEFRVDQTEKRLWITSWRGWDPKQGMTADPDDDIGVQKKWFAPEFDDSKWWPGMSPAFYWMTGDPQYYWCRTHVFVPGDCARKKMTLVLGGIGMFDFRYMRVYLNGHEIGVRRYRGLWHEPLSLDIGEGSRAGRFLRVGQDNVITLQLADPVRRTEKLDKLDPQKTRTLPWLFLIPPQFEQYIAVGESDMRDVKMKVAGVKIRREGQSAAVDVRLQSGQSRIEAVVTYEWNAEEPVLRKKVQVMNQSAEALCLMSVSLGRHKGVANCSDGDQGFPVYAGEHTFFSLAHPAGWNMGQGARVELRQYPGEKIEPRARWQSMEAVTGFALPGRARALFVGHVTTRMRRVRRGHDRAYAIWETFAAWPIADDRFLDDACSEKHILDNLQVMKKAMRAPGNDFDIFHVDFWVDPAGDIRRAAPERFPRQFAPIVEGLKKIKNCDGNSPAMGLWIDSTQGTWSNGRNPVMADSSNMDGAFHTAMHKPLAYICRASEPAMSLYEDGFRYHIRHNGVRMCKFDNFQAICYNTHHNHLPGIYSTEAIMNAAIDFLGALDNENPDVFLMLYWGYRSPWWLLHGDTLFEPGLCVEAAHPSPSPTPYARDGVTLGLDQAQWFAEDIPPLGKDSLGVWLSDWGWNSKIGKERWQEGFIMDMCRGSLLAQPWGDHGALTTDERRQMGEFIRLLRAHPGVFSRPRFILGNPWKHEPYGYCCTDGRRAFVAIHNATWDSVNVPLELDESWGLPPDKEWDLCRWYPRPAQIARNLRGGSAKRIQLRPFEAVLIEVIPAGDIPSLGRSFKLSSDTGENPEGMAQESLRLKTSAAPASKAATLPRESDEDVKNGSVTGVKKAFRITVRIPARKESGLLVLSADRFKKDGSVFQTHYPAREMSLDLRIDGQSVEVEPVLGRFVYPTSWQAWRCKLPPASKSLSVEAIVTVFDPGGVEMRFNARIIPS